MKRVLLVPLLIATSLLAPATSAWACEMAGPEFEEFTFEPNPADTAAPATPVVESVAVEDFGGERSACAHNSCEGSGGLTLTLEPAAEPDLGYRIRVVEGDEIIGSLWDGKVWTDNQGGSFFFGVSTSEPFASTLEITAVDRAGNESPPVRKRVSWDGPETGCATAAGAASPWLATLLALGLRRRGHRR